MRQHMAKFRRATRLTTVKITRIAIYSMAFAWIFLCG